LLITDVLIPLRFSFAPADVSGVKGISQQLLLASVQSTPIADGPENRNFGEKWQNLSRKAEVPCWVRRRLQNLD
jgi:hypothetical protein